MYKRAGEDPAEIETVRDVLWTKSKRGLKPRKPSIKRQVFANLWPQFNRSPAPPAPRRITAAAAYQGSKLNLITSRTTAAAPKLILQTDMDGLAQLQKTSVNSSTKKMMIDQNKSNHAKSHASSTVSFDVCEVSEKVTSV